MYLRKCANPIGRVMRALCHTFSYIVCERMEEMSELVEENARAAQLRQKSLYDQTARKRENLSQMKKYLYCYPPVLTIC